MSPTSRNTLMIGGALILVALLLVCGPLSGRFGSGGSTVEEAPSVAAGPPVDAGATLGAAASGAMAGATIGEVGVGRVAGVTNDDPCARDRDDTDAAAGGDGRDGADCPPLAGAGATMSDAGVSAGAVAAGTAVAAGATAAAVANGGSGGGSGGASASASTNTDATTTASPPPVSAGVPPTAVSALGGVPVVAAAAAGAGTTAAAASGAFDNAVASARNQNGGVGPAGRIVDRFPPPVAAPSNSGMRVASALNRGPLILPCDSPGSGCRNVSGAGTSPPGNLNPPIIPGGRPPGPARNNPPIVPGSRPPRVQ